MLLLLIGVIDDLAVHIAHLQTADGTGPGDVGDGELPDDIMYDAIVKAHEEIQKQVSLINTMVSEIGKEKMTYDHAERCRYTPHRCGSHRGTKAGWTGR